MVTLIQVNKYLIIHAYIYKLHLFYNAISFIKLKIKKSNQKMRTEYRVFILKLFGTISSGLVQISNMTL